MVWLQEVGLAFVFILAGWLLSRLSRSILNWLTLKIVDRTQTHLDDVIMAAGQFPLQMTIFVAGVELGFRQLSMLEGWQPGIAQIFFVAYAFLVFLFLYRLLGGLINWYGREVAHKTETEFDDQFLGLFRYLVQIGLTVTVIIIVLSRYGIEVSALVTTLGIGSLAVALAAQETLGNMLSGFTIMLDRPFKVGDRIHIQDLDTWGDVMEIGLRSTRVLTRDHRMVAIPNKVIGDNLVVNYSDPTTLYRVDTVVGVAYGTDLEHARQVMIAAIETQTWVVPQSRMELLENQDPRLKAKRIEALFLEFGDSSLNFTVRCWIENYVDMRQIVDKMNTVLYQALAQAGIEIPFPQRDLHLVSSQVPLVAADNGRNRD